MRLRLQGSLQGVRVCDGAPVVHHLLFADDSLLFGRVTVEECMVIQTVLDDYEKASGQQVNFTKSDIVFSKAVPPDAGVFSFCLGGFYCGET